MNGHGKRGFVAAGFALIVLGLAVNQWTVGYLRPVARPIVQTKNLLIIWAFQALCIALGYILIRYRHALSEERIIGWYKAVSAVMVAVLLGFVFMNVVLYGANVIRASLGAPNPVSEKYSFSPLSLYPGYTQGQYAKIMGESWSRGFAYDSFSGFKEGPLDGTYVKVDGNGFRHVKDQGPWPPAPGNFNVFLFGASTLFSYGVADDHTLASYLQEFLRTAVPKKTVAVYNFGRGFFYSSQERALFEKLLVQEFVPDVAIFIDGQAEFDAPTLGERPQFTPEIESFFTGASAVRLIDELPLAEWFRNFTTTRRGSTTSTNAFTPTEQDRANARAAVDRYLANKKMIEATAHSFGVKPFFVWQPISGYAYTPDHNPFPTTVGGPGAPFGYPFMASYAAEHPMGNDFFYLADMQKNIKEPLYIDGLHYSGAWSRKVASRIAELLMPKIF